MGLSLTLSSIINTTEKDVANALKNYLQTVDGGIEPADIDNNDKNFCVIQQADGNITIVYPPYFFKTTECAIFISKELQATVFLLDIFDGDFWTYTLFFGGEKKDEFNPIPDYFDENINQGEIDNLKGNLQTITNYVPYVTKEAIEKYLVRWDLDKDESKAYEDDEFSNCEYQLFDFMRKLRLPYQLDNNGNPTGNVFRFWSKDIPLETSEVNIVMLVKTLSETPESKPWWRFWQ